MIKEDLLCEMYHSITVYCAARGLPHLIKLPDLIQAIIDGDEDLARKDAGALTIECIASLAEAYSQPLSKEDAEMMKTRLSIVRTAMESSKSVDDILKTKKAALLALNWVLDKTGQPPVRGLNENEAV